MSKIFESLSDGMLAFGYDKPYGTWFAQVWDIGQEVPHDAPRAVVGYSPDEQAILRIERPEATIGPYPVLSPKQLIQYTREIIGEEAAKLMRDAFIPPGLD